MMMMMTMMMRRRTARKIFLNPKMMMHETTNDDGRHSTASPVEDREEKTDKHANRVRMEQEGRKKRVEQELEGQSDKASERELLITGRILTKNAAQQPFSPLTQDSH